MFENYEKNIFFIFISDFFIKIIEYDLLNISIIY